MTAATGGSGAQLSAQVTKGSNNSANSRKAPATSADSTATPVPKSAPESKSATASASANSKFNSTTGVGKAPLTQFILMTPAVYFFQLVSSFP